MKTAKAFLQEFGRGICVFLLATMLIYGMLVVSPRGVELLSRGHPEEFSVAGGYLTWVKNIVIHQDLGNSKIGGRQPVLQLVLGKGRNTLFMVGIALVVSGICSTIFGYLIRATGHFTLVSMAASVFPYFFSALPAFVVARYLTQTYPELIYTGAQNIWICYIIPGIVLGIADGFLSEMMRHGQGQLTKAKEEGYMLLARAKGAPSWRHLRYELSLNLSQLVFSKITMLVSGTVILEYMFKLPGVGGLAFEAAEKIDVNLLLGTLVILVFMVIVFNFFNKLLWVAIDPRLR